MKFGFKEIVNLFGICLLISTLQLARLTLTSGENRVNLRHGEMRADLDTLVNEIRVHSAFSSLDSSRLKQIESAVDSILYRYPINITSQRFNTEVMKLVAMLNDPGSRTRSPSPATGFLPIRLKPLQGSWLALNEGAQPLDPQHPFITHIDGIPLSRWVSISQQFVPKALQLSPSQQVERLSQLNMLRGEMGLAISDRVRLTLTDHIDSEIQLNLDVAATPLPTRTVIHQPPAAIEKRVSLVKVTELTDFKTGSPSLTQLQFAFEASLTVLDLTDTTGSSDRLLQLLTEEFAEPGTLPPLDETGAHILALSQYRRAIGFRSDFLRPLHFRPFDEFDFFEQIALTDISQQIEIENSEGFGLWHGRYTPLPSSAKSNMAASGEGHVALLIGPGCRKECEWIAYVAKSLPGVTLVGERTFGDFGRHYSFKLPHSKIDVKLTASIIYNARGELLSGQGTRPDIELPIDESIHWEGLLTLLTEAKESSGEPLATTSNRRFRQGDTGKSTTGYIKALNLTTP
ncbi:S41 family peptidase [uncultured Shewanella sp.]|uniref:S41 family peptidase n=1 Tax=uncultured Shewanella sp. TaxID=173975 RepID=UPI00261785C6|nr:S41 family peptidase [uncultured Shewanella sp.]